jgi:hypothetical protein
VCWPGSERSYVMQDGCLSRTASPCPPSEDGEPEIGSGSEASLVGAVDGLLHCEAASC